MMKHATLPPAVTMVSKDLVPLRALPARPGASMFREGMKPTIPLASGVGSLLNSDTAPCPEGST